MNRDIKFRAWDKADKYMMENVYMRRVNMAFIDFKRSCEGPRWTVNMECSDIILLQYTGINDMNKGEIHEGDIVRLHYGIPPTIDTLVIEFTDGKYVHDMLVSGWWMNNIRENGCSACLCKTYQNDLEIIGNIYENSELLEA